MKNTIYFTICSANYVSYALTLAQSLDSVSPGAKLHLFLADRLPPDVTIPTSNLELIPIESIGIADLSDMAFRYSILEFNTAVKPYCFLHLLETLGLEAAVYLDPDILLVRPLDHVEAALAGGESCVMTPHITHGLNDGKHPSEDTFLTTGVFNLGFAAFSNSAEALAFLRWWAGKTRRDCLVALDRGIFTDQSYCNFAPCFIARFVSLRSPAYNLAYWNLAQRKVARDGEELFVEGEPLRFIHYSGIDPHDPTSFSKHQDRYARNMIGPLQDITDAYVGDLKRNDTYPGGRFSALPYAFARMNNGAKLSPALRWAYARFSDRVAGQDPFALEAGHFREADPDYPSFGDSYISTLYAAVWEKRSDLQQAFDIRTQHGQLRYLAWAEDNLQREMDVPRDSIVSLSTEQRKVARLDPGGKGWQVQGMDPAVEQTLTSPGYMLRNLLRRQLMGKERLRDYWRRRMQADVTSGPAPEPKLSALSGAPRQGVEIFGYFHTESGVGQAARGMVAAMHAQNLRFDATALNAPSEFVNDVAFPDLGNGGTSAKILFCANADSIVAITNGMSEESLRGRYRIGHWTWELPVFPAAWAPSFDRLDEIWVPSRFVARAVRSGTTKPVRIVPYVVEAGVANQAAAREQLGLSREAFMFLTTFDLNSYPARKNPLAVVTAFRNAFPDPKDRSVQLVVKFHGRGKGPDIRAGLHEASLQDPRITLIDAVYTPQDMVRLRWACDALVSLHRSEGFGLNIGEAMAAGKLVIATDFSGNRDFLNSQNGIPIPYALKAVAADEYPFGEGQHWAEPDHDAVVEAMRWAHANDAAALRARARSDMAAGNSPKAIGRIIAEALAGRSTIAID